VREQAFQRDHAPDVVVAREHDLAHATLAEAPHLLVPRPNGLAHVDPPVAELEMR
jgi:hypothetical protein